MEDRRSQRIVELKRRLALLEIEEQRLLSVVQSSWQTDSSKLKAERDLELMREILAELAKELSLAEMAKKLSKAISSVKPDNE